MCHPLGVISRPLVAWCAIGLAAALPIAAAAQRGGFFGFGRRGLLPNVVYDGRFTFVRTQYARYGGWAADYPTMETNLSTILREITELRPHDRGSNVHTFDDPELLRYPVAYLSEPGYWYPDNSEVLGLRQYLQKGGFLIVDDFHFPEEWAVFDIAIHKVLPGVRVERLDISHPIFNSFFPIKSLEVPYPGRLGEMGLMGEFYGIHDINDPANRLMVIVNYNIDIGDYIEWSPNGVYAVAPTNEAYKFAINYLIYGLTH